MSFLKHFEENKSGRDFFVGDLHGCFQSLQKAMDKVSFNENIDRIFSVGDLIDRGQSSADIVELLKHPYFHAVRGNHEQVLLNLSEGTVSEGFHRALGGGWWYDESLHPTHRKGILTALQNLPYMIEIETKFGLVGVVHAEVWAEDWIEATKELCNIESPWMTQVQNACLWRRDKIRFRSTSKIRNISAVIVGHTPVKKIEILGNAIYIDLGIGTFEEHSEIELLELGHILSAFNTERNCIA